MHQLLYRAYRYLGYTQEELHRITGFEKTQINRWLNSGKSEIELGDGENSNAGFAKLLTAIQKTAIESGDRWIDFLQTSEGEEALKPLKDITYFTMDFEALQNQSLWSINVLPIEVNNRVLRDYVFQQLFDNTDYPDLHFTYWIPKSSKEEMIGFLRHLQVRLSQKLGTGVDQTDILKKITVVLSPMSLCVRNMLIVVGYDDEGRPIHRYAIRNARNTYDFNFEQKDIAASLVAKFESSRLFNYLSTTLESIELGKGEFTDGDNAFWQKLDAF